MSWTINVPPKTVRVTSKLAKEWAEMESPAQDRPISERRLTVYRKTLKDNGFRPVLWAKAYCKEMDAWYRVNGKHTSTLFSSIDLDKTQDLFAVIEEYQCDTIEDVAHLYSTFDSSTQTRNQHDINRMFAASIPELKELDAKLINLLVGALAYSVWPSNTGGTPPGTTAADRAELLFDNTEFCVWVSKLIPQPKVHQHLRRVPVVAAMKGCWTKAKSAAFEFWTSVRDETGKDPNTPDRKLAKFLGQMVLTTGARGNIPKRFRITTKEFYVKSIKAWNSWRKNEPTDLKYFADAKIPSFS